MRWVVAGYGDVVVRRVVPALRELGQDVTGLCGRRADRAAAVAADLGVPRSATGVEPLLDDVDAVYVATPVAAHLATAAAAVRAGRHVLVEKPVCGALHPDPADLAVLATAPGLATSLDRATPPGRSTPPGRVRPGVSAGQPTTAAPHPPGPAGRPCPVVAVAYYRRLSPALLRLRERLAGVAVREVRVRFRAPFDPGPAHPMRWRTELAVSGGGVLADAGSHRIDLLCWLLGPPAAVSGTLADRFPGGAERRARVRLTWPGGVSASLDLAWCSPPAGVRGAPGSRVRQRPPAADGPFRGRLETAGARRTTAAGPPADEARQLSVDRLEVLFDGGWAVLDPLDGGVLRWQDRTGEHVERFPVPANPHVALVADLLRAVRDGGGPACPLAAGLLVDGVIRTASERNGDGWVRMAR